MIFCLVNFAVFVNNLVLFGFHDAINVDLFFLQLLYEIGGLGLLALNALSHIFLNLLFEAETHFLVLFPYHIYQLVIFFILEFCVYVVLHFFVKVNCDKIRFCGFQSS